MSNKSILDVCCGSRMFWFDKQNPNAVYMDNRIVDDVLCDERKLHIAPDIVGDFRNIPFKNNSFSLVVFDPPHLIKVGENSWMSKKYGRLNPDTYKSDLKQGFKECFRVLKENGVLIFKWSEIDVKTSEIIALSPVPPLFGHRSGKLSKTQWIVFMKRG